MSKKYVVELKGVGVVNKGAFLMFLSILQNLQEINCDIEICMEPNSSFTYEELIKYGIKPKIGFRDKKLPWDSIFKLISKKNRENYGLVHNEDIDLIIDASGFAYGDYWGDKYIKKRMNNLVGNKVGRDTKLIFMPQAFGPFKKKKLKKPFGKLIDRASLIFVRDRKSYSYLEKSFGKKDKFLLSPDFTNLLNSGKAKKYDEGDLCIIPNTKMLQDERSKEEYLSFMSFLINHLISKNETPYFLIHEGDSDFNLAKSINSKLIKELPIVAPEDPIVIKNRIKSSKLTIVSRYHGLVSALSQGIPVLATSWSHKYKELMKDYKKEDYLIDLYDYQKEDLIKKVEYLLALDLKDYKFEQENIIENEKQKVQVMWSQIRNVI